MKAIEEECLQFFKISRLIQGSNHDFMVDDNDDDWVDYSEYNDYVNVDLNEECQPHAANACDYKFGNAYESNLCQKYLHPDIHKCTYHLSSRD